MAGTVPQPGEINVRRIVQSVRELYEGRSNAIGRVTLAASATTTAVTAVNCGLGSVVLLFPETADAAAEVAAGGLYVSAVGAGSFTLTHANDASTDRTFAWVALG